MSDIATKRPPAEVIRQHHERKWVPVGGYQVSVETGRVITISAKIDGPKTVFGWAMCDPSDNWVRKFGNKIATARRDNPRSAVTVITDNTDLSLRSKFFLAVTSAPASFPAALVRVARGHVSELLMEAEAETDTEAN